MGLKDRAQRRESGPTLGVYVSVPFCRAKCSFCNFASGVSTAEAVEAYVRRLCAEIAAAGERAEQMGAVLPRVVDSVYFGGGTPSLLEPEQLGRIFAALRGEFRVQADAEITMEAAPGQIEDALLETAQRMGVSRVSLGVQSFVDRESAAVGRLHTGAGCAAEIRRLRAAGVREVGADLIAGLPYQTATSWESSLQQAAELAAEGALTHLSVYMLEVDEGSRLGREVLNGGARLHAPAVASDELTAELYEQACERLETAGFAQYEISNFALAECGDAEAHRSRHNVKYWRREPYVGFGLEAHSMLETGAGAVRFANPRELAAYHATTDPTDVTRVDADVALEEAIFLGLRLTEGVSVAELREEFGRGRVAGCEEASRELIADGFLLSADGRWRLSGAGRLVSNEVFTQMLMSVAA